LRRFSEARSIFLPKKLLLVSRATAFAATTPSVAAEAAEFNTSFALPEVRSPEPEEFARAEPKEHVFVSTNL
jgi:hypothetical protein